MKKMKKTLYIAGFIGLLAVAAGCAREQEGIGASASRPEESTSSAVPGMIRLKVNEDLAETLIAAADEDGNVSAEAAAALRIEGVAVKAVSTTFHIGGPFLKQQKESGLHRWFDVEYDKTEPVSKAVSGFSGMDGIDWIEPIYIPVKNDVKMNDPDYSVQWHYHNTGQGSGRKGIDMKLQEAWDQYGMFGNSNVIVAILDSGVDYDHPDLAGNVWTNEAELNGTPGVDDDGNGYKDDVHGYNFVAGSAEIHPEDHGTHVAGTVGAVNNNGVGVCGVAGGRYPEKGVRLMCLQIMDATLPDKGASLAKVMQYAAENGAVIAQNSWGYKKDVTTMPSADKEAIDYFIEKAGMKDGKQVGPMAGGLVVLRQAMTVRALHGLLSMTRCSPWHPSDLTERRHITRTMETGWMSVRRAETCSLWKAVFTARCREENTDICRAHPWPVLMFQDLRHWCSLPAAVLATRTRNSSRPS